MIIAHYAHRLPADYDISIIRNRASRRGALFDDVPELHFKGFLLRERGHYGAIANEYSSLYLWRTDQGFGDFLVTGRYKSVTDSFGRAQIEMRIALDARKGPAQEARFATKEEQQIPLDADLTTTFAAEIERNREIARQSGVVAAAIGVDVQNWKLTRVLLSEREPRRTAGEEAYQILYLARPLLGSLPTASA
ncbi:DUF4865 family protein [Bradyrhizobium sp.]|uniref:DUF4865 family protein n=1 Tax=Bradyrhizobium sp. TaxID=376 RepID=UPI003C58B82D